MAEITAAPATVTIDGTQYLMSPLTDKDISEVDLWLRATYVNMARAALDMKPEFTQEQRDEEMRHARMEARRLTWISGEGAELMSDVEGLSRIMWQGIKRNHPDVTFEAFKAKLYDPRKMTELLDDFKELNYARLPGTQKEGDAPNGAPKSASTVEGGDVRPARESVQVDL